MWEYKHAIHLHAPDSLTEQTAHSHTPVAMKGVKPVEGAPLGMRVVRADRQVVAGLVYYLQVRLHALRSFAFVHCGTHFQLVGWLIDRGFDVCFCLPTLQVELWTATRCEVHERQVYVDLQVRTQGQRPLCSGFITK